MADWSVLDREWPPDLRCEPYPYGLNAYYQEKPPLLQSFSSQAQQYMPPASPTLTLLLSPPQNVSPTPRAPSYNDYAILNRGDSPREIRNKAEKQRRDKLNHSISELAAIVPPVVAANRKIDKTGILRLTAHFLRAHQHVFGDSIRKTQQQFSSASTQAVLTLLKGFLLTTTCKGIVVVASQNVQQYLGYSELDLLGQHISNITHQDDHQILKDNLMPKSHLLGPHGELLLPEEPDARQKVADELANEKKRFIIRFKKLTQRSEPAQYVTCSVEGTLRKSDRACPGHSRGWNMVRRSRARGDSPCSSGNDVVFIGLVRPTTETFLSESNLESFKMEYRTRHSIDGEIIQCEQRIALVTGYMTHEVNGVNAMNFMHRDDVRWVIIALREMYDQHRMVGESCYRLMTKNGQFIYMRTRGCLDVEGDSRAVRSFVCTNTVVEEPEGKHLIKMMKKKFMLLVNNNDEPPPEEDNKDVTDNQTVPVEDPRQLEKVILHLVTNLPSPQPEDCRSVSPDCGNSPSLPLAIIPPEKERIVSAIEKIYSVIKTFQREPSKIQHEMQNRDNTDRSSTPSPSSSPTPSRNPADTNRRRSELENYGNYYLRQQIDFGAEPSAPLYHQQLLSLRDISTPVYYRGVSSSSVITPWYLHSMSPDSSPRMYYQSIPSRQATPVLYHQPTLAHGAMPALYNQPTPSPEQTAALLHHEPTTSLSRGASIICEHDSNSNTFMHSSRKYFNSPQMRCVAATVTKDKFDDSAVASSSSKSLAGTKRPNECDRMNTVMKKKSIESANIDEVSKTPEPAAEQNIDKLLDENSVTDYSQIDTVMESVLGASSASFNFNFGLLMGQDDQGPLGDIEEQAELLMGENEPDILIDIEEDSKKVQPEK